MYQLT